MNLKPQDVLVALKLAVLEGEGWSYPSLVASIHLSLGELHKSVQRLNAAGLFNDHTRAPRRAALEEFLIHGVKYAFPAERKGITRGVPTAWAAAPLKEHLAPSDESPPVWPHPNGTARGAGFSPLYASAPDAALDDPKLYELLALLDGIRGGGARERNLSVELLRERLKLQPARLVVSDKALKKLKLPKIETKKAAA